MIKELTSFPKRARTIDWEDGKLIFDGDKVMLMPELSVEVMQQIGAYPALVGFHVKHYPLTDEQIQPLAGAKKMVNVGIEYAELTDLFLWLVPANPLSVSYGLKTRLKSNTRQVFNVARTTRWMPGVSLSMPVVFKTRYVITNVPRRILKD